MASRDSDATHSVKSVFVKWSSEIPSAPSTSAATCSETLDANGNSEVTAPRRWEIRSAQADFRLARPMPGHSCRQISWASKKATFLESSMP